MDTLAVGMSAASFILVMGTWVKYFSTVPGGKVPARPIGSIIIQCLGIVLAVAANVWNYQSTRSFSIAVIVPAVLALMMGLFFLWLLTQRKTPIGDLKVKVGDTLLPFETKTSDGGKFHTDDLSGKRVLLKFFRGGW